MSDYGTPTPGQEAGTERPPEQVVDEERDARDRDADDETKTEPETEAEARGEETR